VLYGIYPDFIYLNNGELNWDAISTISNFILVSLLVVVALYEAHERTKSMKKAQERIIVLDMIKNFLYPCLEQMKNTIQNINNNEFYWNQSTGKSKISFISKIPDSQFGRSLAKADVFKEHRELEALCSEYDKLLDEIIQVYDEIARTIENTKKTECLKDFVRRFQEKGYELNKEEITDVINFNLQVFVNYKYYQKYELDKNSGTKLLNFNENILKCIKTKECKELDKVGDVKIDLFTDKINEIIKECEEKMDYYRKVYHISEDEMK